MNHAVCAVCGEAIHEVGSKWAHLFLPRSRKPWLHEARPVVTRAA